MYGLKEPVHSFGERNDLMLTEFPIIHTNIWDAIWAIPVILVVVLMMKVFFKIPSSLVIYSGDGRRISAIDFHQPSGEFVRWDFHGLFLRCCGIWVHVFGKKFLHRLSYKIIGFR